MSDLMAKFWKCEDCGAKLPRCGLIWASRFKKWKERKRTVSKPSSGFYCNFCVERERY